MMKEKSKRRAASSRSSELSSPEEEEREEERRGNEEEPVGGARGRKLVWGGSLFFGDTIAGVDLVWGGGGGPHTNQDTTLQHTYLCIHTHIRYDTAWYSTQRTLHDTLAHIHMHINIHLRTRTYT